MCHFHILRYHLYKTNLYILTYHFLQLTRYLLFSIQFQNYLQVKIRVQSIVLLDWYHMV